MKKSFSALSILVIIIGCFAIRVFATNGHQLMGIGAYGKSMAGAVQQLPLIPQPS